MTPLNQAQTPFIDNALAGMRTAYNRFDVLPCEFTGQPEDLAALDVIPYELPMAEEFAAGSVAYSLAWGHVLATSFGFRWVAEADSSDPRLFALQLTDPTALLFPYIRLLEITHSFGHQDSPAASLWFDVIRLFDHRSSVPDGWHPVFDAARRSDGFGGPTSVADVCGRLIEAVPHFYTLMSTHPYRWARHGQWDRLADYAAQLISSARLAKS